MKKYIIIIAIIIASMASVFGQESSEPSNFAVYSKDSQFITVVKGGFSDSFNFTDYTDGVYFIRQYYNDGKSEVSRIEVVNGMVKKNDSSFTVKNLLYQDVFTGIGEWNMPNPTTTEQVKNAYGVELQSGVYFIYRNGKEEGKFIVR